MVSRFLFNVRHKVAAASVVPLVFVGVLAAAPARASNVLTSSAITVSAFEPDEMDQTQEFIMFETIVAEPITSSAGDRQVRFEAPDGCAFNVGSAEVSCGGVAYSFGYTVIDSNGNELPAAVWTDADDVVVTAQGSSNTAGDVTFNMVATEETVDGVTPEEINDSFVEMTVEDQRYIYESELSSEEAMLSDDAVEYTPWVIAPPASGGLQPIPNAAVKRPAKVGVPSNYKYCRVWTSAACKPKSLHDYCTWSPDQPIVRFGSYEARVDFRGPCARHDLAIGKIVKNGGSLATKKSKRRSADRTFRDQMFQNCAHEFWRTNSISKGLKASCRNVSTTYYKAVSKKTESWNGK